MPPQGRIAVDVNILDLLAPTPLSHTSLRDEIALSEFNNHLSYFQQKQLQTNWCWAAVTVSIYSFYGRFLSQCELISRFFSSKGGASCCDDPGNPSCNQALLTEKALQNVNIFAEAIDAWIPYNRIKQQIDGSRPISCSIKWPSGAGHAVVIDGYLQMDENAEDWVYVQDPGTSADAVCMLYATFRTNYRTNGRWALTCLTRTPV